MTPDGTYSCPACAEARLEAERDSLAATVAALRERLAHYVGYAYGWKVGDPTDDAHRHWYDPDETEYGPATLALLADTAGQVAAYQRQERLAAQATARAALQRISENHCGIPGHAVAIGCGSSVMAAEALAAMEREQ